MSTATTEYDAATLAAHPGLSLIGRPVLAYHYDNPAYVYAGPGREPGISTLSVHVGQGWASITHDPDKVAPADTPIPAKSDRVNVYKIDPKSNPWRYKWAVTVDGELITQTSTKREATATGLRVVAIKDWQAAQRAAA